MKIQEAMKIIHGAPAGFMVAFEHVDGSILKSDHFPDVRNGEPPIGTEEEAWQLAARFAAKTRERCVNVYVIRREDYTPVPSCHARMIKNR